MRNEMNENLTEQSGRSSENSDVPILGNDYTINKEFFSWVWRTTKYAKSTGLRGALYSREVPVSACVKKRVLTHPKIFHLNNSTQFILAKDEN